MASGTAECSPTLPGVPVLEWPVTQAQRLGVNACDSPSAEQGSAGCWQLFWNAVECRSS